MKIKRFFKFGVVILIFAVLGWLGWWTDPTPRIAGTVKIYDRNGQLIYESAGIIRSQQPTELEKIPNDLKNAVIVTEDERFWDHPGIDALAILRAIKQNIEVKKIISGASTIEQQLARFSVISPQKPAPVTWTRKIREILIALRLARTKSKDDTLESYLNVVHLGRGTYGLQSASRVYFGTDVDQLSLAQSALLAGMIANPSRFDPINHPELARKRRDLVLTNLLENKLINNEVYERALGEPLPHKVNILTMKSPHVVQMVLKEIDKLGINKDQGLKVNTTIDLGWTELAEEIARNQVDGLHDQHNLTNASVVVIENQTGDVWVMLGGVDYWNEQIGGQNNTALALRQPGSAMKPVTYAAAFQSGMATPATLIEDVPKVYQTHDQVGWIPHNYDGKYRGPVLVREALAASYNLPAVEMLSRVGIKNFLDLAHQMGISSMQDTDRYDLALTLGGGEVNLLELTNLYATFARQGNWIPYTLINQITTDDNTLIYQSENQSAQRVLDDRVTWLVTSILSDEKARIPTFGEKNPLVLSRSAAVKTGTTTDWHDNWTIGYTPEYTIGVWVGNADNSPMINLSGVTGAAPIWHQLFEEILKVNPGTEFIKPNGIIEQEICAWDGLLPAEKCTERYQEYFIEGTAPNEFSQLEQKPNKIYSSALQIINPKSSAIFEYRSLNQQEIVFEMSAFPEIKSISWILDGKLLTDNECRSLNNLDCAWLPELGDHILSAQARLISDQDINVPEVNFKVVEYKEGWE